MTDLLPVVLGRHLGFAVVLGDLRHLCRSPSGPCVQPESSPILSSYGRHRARGGSLFQDPSGNWMIDYAAWQPGCTDYSCGGPTAVRRTGHPGPPGLACPVTGMAPRRAATATGWSTPRVRYPATARSWVYGSMAGQHLNAPIDHIVATPDGRGYWLVAADGGIFTFGDAGFYGSMGGQHLNAPVVDIAPTRDGGGYWLVASDGGIFSLRRCRVPRVDGGQHLNRRWSGSVRRRHRRLLGGGLRRGDLRLRRTLLRLHRCDPTSTDRSTGCPPPPTAAATGSWPRTAASSPSATAAFQGSMGGTPSMPLWWAWPPTRRPAGTGWWRPTAGIFSFGAPFWGCRLTTPISPADGLVPVRVRGEA